VTPDYPAQQTVTTRVSVVARLVPALSYAIPMLGAAMGALMVFNLLRAMRSAEAAGVSAVAGGLAEANLPIIIAIYFGIVVGFVGLIVGIVRTAISVRTASPAAWFFLLIGVLSFIPTALFWEAQSILTNTIASRGNVSLVATSINLCLTLTLISTAVLGLLFLVATIVPLPASFRTKRSYGPLIVLVLMEMALIGMTVLFQLHNSWLYEARQTERF